MKKKLSAIALALALTMGLTIPALAASVTNFTDVPSNAWYYDYVRTACDRGLISGTSGTTFSPNDTMTRGQFVTVLGRYAGVNTGAVVNTGKFTDVPAAEYYAPYVYWASEKGIVYGTGDSTFSPSVNITKEQMATLLVRYASSEGLTIPADSSISFTFADAADISAYARDSVDALKNAGIITGNEYGNFQPQKSISRAEATTMLVKFITVVEKDDDFIDCLFLNASILNDNGYTTSEIKIGETRRITVSFVPENTTIDRTCTFVSSDTSVLTVDETGLVTAKSAGKGNVRVTASNGVSVICYITVQGVNSQLTDFELVWGDEWNIGTYYNNGTGYYFFDLTIMGEVTTQTRKIGEDSSYMLLTPRLIYSDGKKQSVLPEDYSTYKFSFTSSDPSLVTLNSNSAIIVHRVINPGESPQTVTITIYSDYFKTSKTVTITLYHHSN